MKLTLAHLSDIHLAPIEGVGPGHFNVKRALGFTNWMLKRRKVHLRSAVDALVADLAKQSVDHIIVSGDLVNLGLPGEHAAAHRWLQSLGPPDRVSVVPGNHDIYCRLWRDEGVGRWRAYMSSNEAGRPFLDQRSQAFPYVRVLGRLAIVGVNSAIPTKPFSAIGRIGTPQLDALAATLDRLHAAGLFRLVVVHHPPLTGQADARRGLTDAGAMERVLLTHGADLVLHGHNHRDMHAARQTRHGDVHVLGVASASVGRPRHAGTAQEEPTARYNLIRLTPGEPGPAITVETRGITGPAGPVAPLGERRLR